MRAIIAFLALATVTACSGQNVDSPLTTKLKEIYQAKIAAVPTDGPWLSTPSRDPYGGDREIPTSYASVLIYEADHFQATGDAAAGRRIKTAVQFLLSDADEDGDGVPGWGLTYAAQGFGPDLLPANTAYSPITAFVAQGLIAALKSGALDAETETAVRGVLKAAVMGWSKSFFIWDSPTMGFYLYSSELAQLEFTPNVSAMMGGVFAEFLTRYPEEFTRGETVKIRATLNACAQMLTDAFRPDTFSWFYSDSPAEDIDFNNFDHHLTIIDGLERMRKYLDVGLPYTTREALDSFDDFIVDGVPYDYPAALRDASPDIDPFNRLAPPTVLVLLAQLRSRTGDQAGALASLSDIWNQYCGDPAQKCPITANVAPIIYGGDL